MSTIVSVVSTIVVIKSTPRGDCWISSSKGFLPCVIYGYFVKSREIDPNGQKLSKIFLGSVLYARVLHLEFVFPFFHYLTAAASSFHITASC